METAPKNESPNPLSMNHVPFTPVWKKRKVGTFLWWSILNYT